MARLKPTPLVINTMDLLFSASFIASFFAGVAALFAPCCITVLLPTYFASIFKQKAKIFLMTFIYFLGLLSIFLPIGLGVSFLSQIFREYHNIVFLTGGIFLILLGLSLVLGKSFSFNSPVHPEMKGTGLLSIFLLGVFSAIATTCCAPVLAGVLALSALPGSFVLGGIFTLAYVLGMVLPLFFIAALLDKRDFTKKFFAFRKTINYELLGRKITLTFANLFSGVMFLALGIIIVILARAGKIESHSDYQLMVNIYITKLIKSVESVTKFIPEPIWGIIFVSIFILIVIHAVRDWKRRSPAPN